MDRNQLDEWDRRALDAQAKAAQAYLRLVEIAERSDSGQARRVACFLASTFNGAARTTKIDATLQANLMLSAVGGAASACNGI